MRDVQRLTADEFFAWQALVEGRYELVDGHIVPHPDYGRRSALPRPMPLRPINTGEPLSHKFIRPYALCYTPVDLLSCIER